MINPDQSIKTCTLSLVFGGVAQCVTDENRLVRMAICANGQLTFTSLGRCGVSRQLLSCRSRSASLFLVQFKLQMWRPMGAGWTPMTWTPTNISQSSPCAWVLSCDNWELTTTPSERSNWWSFLLRPLQTIWPGRAASKENNDGYRTFPTFDQETATSPDNN